MKKTLLTLVLFFMSYSIVSANSSFGTVEESLSQIDYRAESQGYHIPVARKYLVDAYFSEGKYTEAEKKHIWSLVRELEWISEEKYRKSPRYEVTKDKKEAKLYGQIDSTIFKKTIDLINANPWIQTIQLVYVPGSHDDVSNHAAWRIIRNQWIWTKINEYWFIASWWTDLLMSWKTRQIAPGAQIWVHARTSPAVPSPREIAQDSDVHNEYVDYFTEMWLNESLYRRTLYNTRPGNIHWLTTEELQTYWF